jgi:hypothetical protein
MVDPQSATDEVTGLGCTMCLQDPCICQRTAEERPFRCPGCDSIWTAVRHKVGRSPCAHPWHDIEDKGESVTSKQSGDLVPRLYCAAQGEYGAFDADVDGGWTARLLREAAAEIERLRAISRPGDAAAFEEYMAARGVPFETKPLHEREPPHCPTCECGLPVEMAAAQGLNSVSFEPRGNQVALILCFDTLEHAKQAREHVSAALLSEKAVKTKEYTAQDIPWSLPITEWPDIVAAIHALYDIPRAEHKGCGAIALAAADEITKLRSAEKAAERPGMWVCSECKGDNFPEDRKCVHCGAQKSEQCICTDRALGDCPIHGSESLRLVQKTGGWRCAYCDQWNESGTACHACGLDKQRSNSSEVLTRICEVCQTVHSGPLCPRPMAMLPNDHHPGPGCSCRDCLSAYPDRAAIPRFGEQK